MRLSDKSFPTPGAALGGLGGRPRCFFISCDGRGKSTPSAGCNNPRSGLLSQVMQESIYQFVMEQLQIHKGRWQAVADGSGVSRRTIEKIARAEIEDPGVSHIEKLAGYFRESAN